MSNVSNVSSKLNVVLNCKLNPLGVENLQKKLKSYNLGKEFNYAIAVLKILVGNGENSKEDNINGLSVSVNFILKVQYITPFVNKELAEKYLDELLSLNKLVMFLPIGEDGRVILEDINFKSFIEKLKNN